MPGTLLDFYNLMKDRQGEQTLSHAGQTATDVARQLILGSLRGFSPTHDMTIPTSIAIPASGVIDAPSLSSSVEEEARKRGIPVDDLRRKLDPSLNMYSNKR